MPRAVSCPTRWVRRPPAAPAPGRTPRHPSPRRSWRCPSSRYATFGHAYYDITESVQGFVEGSFGHVDGSVDQSRYFGAALPIYADNPYVPAAIRALIPAASATPSGTRPALPNFQLAVLGQRRGHSSFRGRFLPRHHRLQGEAQRQAGLGCVLPVRTHRPLPVRGEQPRHRRLARDQPAQQWRRQQPGFVCLLELGE